MYILILYIILLIIIYFYLDDNENFDCSCNINYMKLFKPDDKRPFFDNQDAIYFDNSFNKIDKYKPYKASLFTTLNPFQKIFKNMDANNPTLKNIIKSTLNL